jgi:hypothetical protein
MDSKPKEILKIKKLRGIAKKKGQRPVSLKAMKRAIVKRVENNQKHEEAGS